MGLISTTTLLLLGSPFAVQQQMPGKITNSDSQIAVKVTVDGERIDFKGAPPQMQGSRILVPLRGVFEHMGAQLTWNQASRTVTAVRDGAKVIATVGKRDAMINGQVAAMDQPPIVAEGRIMVPLRFLAHALGAEVEYMAADRTVVIQTKLADKKA